jgi:hypothetical protein
MATNKKLIKEYPIPRRKVIEGYAGINKVTAYVYFGADSGLSYFVFLGKTFSGTVEFTRIDNEYFEKY